MRNENLTKKVFIDLKIVAFAGIELIKSIFLRIYKNILDNEEFYIVGKLFIEPMINFLSKIDRNEFRKELIKLNKISIQKIEAFNPKKILWPKI